MQVFSFTFFPPFPSSAIPFKNNRLQSTPRPEAIAAYTMSGLDDRSIWRKLRELLTRYSSFLPLSLLRKRRPSNGRNLSSTGGCHAEQLQSDSLENCSQQI